jgi:hypothetical protein
MALSIMRRSKQNEYPTKRRIYPNHNGNSDCCGRACMEVKTIDNSLSECKR